MDTVNINEISPRLATLSVREVVFIEDNLQDWALLSSQIAAKADVVILDSRLDGLSQIAAYLSARQPGSLDAIHVLSHGAAGQLNLGGVTLTQDSLSQYRAELNAIGQTLGEDGDLLLYGCNIGAGEAGETLVRQLAAITRADVAASSNLTGASALGGDWALEMHSGLVNSTALTLDEYMGTLALTVTNNFATGVGTPEDLAIDSQNNLYVVSIDDNTLYKYAASGGAITGGAVNTAFATITNATCVAIDTAGNLYLGTGSGINI
jgi:hypothetical protein